MQLTAVGSSDDFYAKFNRLIKKLKYPVGTNSKYLFGKVIENTNNMINRARKAIMFNTTKVITIFCYSECKPNFAANYCIQ